MKIFGAIRQFTLMMGLLLSMLSGPATAALLTFTPSDTSFTVKPGELITVKGEIINRTINSLSSTDLILNFNDYDPTSLTPVQRLGEIDFTILSFSLISNVTLFDLNIPFDARTGQFTTLVTLQDIYGNLSDTVEFHMIVSGDGPSNPIPLPATPALLFLGAVALAITRTKKISQSVD